MSQARVLCERYEIMARRCGNRPPFYVTHISGIFDEYLKKSALRQGIVIDPTVLGQVGLAIARKEYRMIRELGCGVTMLGGGARETYHFTGLIRARVHITINWKTAEQIISSGIAVKPSLQEETPEAVAEELRAKLPDFRMAYDEGLLPGEFASFGPVQLFRNSFLKGWYLLLAQTAIRRHALAL